MVSVSLDGVNLHISRASLALAATVVLWASAFPAIRIGLDGYGAAGLSFTRLAVASAALLIAAPLLRVRRPAPRDLPLIALCGATGMSAYQLSLNWGEVHVPAGTASLLIASAPVFSVLLATAFLGERLTRAKVLGSVIAVMGCAVIALAGGDTHYTTAAWAILAAALVQGVYHFAGKPLLARHTGVEVACYATWAGTLFLLPLAPQAVHVALHAPPGASAAAVFLGLLPSAVGFAVWGYAVARLTVTTATAALYLVPPVAIAVAFVWLHEVPHVIELAGGAISLAGVILISRHRRPAAVEVASGGHTAHPGLPSYGEAVGTPGGNRTRCAPL